jgi:O-antigen biosynthesis protein WbqP
MNRPIFRALDIALVVGTSFLTIPLCLLVWCALRLFTEHPLFIQSRLKASGEEFEIYKFRTLGEDVDASLPTHLLDRGSVTPIGKILRKSKLDELPQLLNVALGDLSLVGPRPCLPSQSEVIAEREKLGIFLVKPGITGLAQLRGIDMSQPSKVAQADAEMISKFSIYMYFSVILKTAIGLGAGDTIRKLN